MRTAAERHARTSPSTYAEHGTVDPVRRDPSRTRAEAMNALQVMRDTLSYSEWANSGQLKAYVSAAVNHGAVLRDNVACDTAEAWEAHGVTDDQIADKISRLEAYDATRDELTARRKELEDEAERLVDSSPDWETNKELQARVNDMYLRSAIMLEDWNNVRLELSRDLFHANETRFRLHTEAVLGALRGEREIGGTSPELADTARLSKNDRALLSDVTSMFPSDMVALANARTEKLRPVRSKKRAHYGARTPQKTKESKAGVLSARDALNGEQFWHLNMDFVTLTDDNRLEDRMIAYRDTVESTPENRAALQSLITDHAAKYERRAKARIPHTVEVEFDTDSGPQKRLALYIPEATSQFTTSKAPTVSELTFNDKASMAHEFGHHMEYANPEIAFACKEFLRRRTEGMERVVYKKGERGKSDEVVTPDGFVDSYIGKHYDTSLYATEVFSMGVEALFAGEHGGLLGLEIDTTSSHAFNDRRRYRADPEHFAMVMGLLAVANKPAQTIT